MAIEIVIIRECQTIEWLVHWYWQHEKFVEQAQVADPIYWRVAVFIIFFSTIFI